jgi:predicted RNA binding protein YcfA (HicA-like mRNA interferase family)
MSKQEKLLERFLSIPADFTWDELKKVLAALGYLEMAKGKTAGSRKKFVHKDGNLILLHKPHPSNIVKKYALKQTIENLNEKGKLNHE